MLLRNSYENKLKLHKESLLIREVEKVARSKDAEAEVEIKRTSKASKSILYTQAYNSMLVLY
ncbi:MAG: hypothetical protein Pg6B_10050 [Candidatus Azobacteroides pseudotrichonymphae]|nr:MAG: hypothetical protein Pg6B_10050 [Candidatus Azobacteroides pseudotrichonymphae]